MVVGTGKGDKIIVDRDYVGVVFGNNIHLRTHDIYVSGTTYHVFVLGRDFRYDGKHFRQILSGNLRQVVTHVGNHCGK